MGRKSSVVNVTDFSVKCRKYRRFSLLVYKDMSFMSQENPHQNDEYHDLNFWRFILFVIHFWKCSISSETEMLPQNERLQDV